MMLLLNTNMSYIMKMLSAGSKVGFEMSTYSYTNFAIDDIASYEVYAYPTQFNYSW